MENILGISDFRFRDTSFANLMNKRIHNVLLIATKYDSFILEDDGRIDEQIFYEYTSLNLRYPPRFTLVATEDEALAALNENHFELIIQMPNMDEADMFALSRHLKSLYPDTPFVVLTPFSVEVSKRLENEDMSSVDYVFSWLGNSELLLAIIKLIEDSMNVEHDTESVGVQTILLVEDSIRFYSSALPTLYKIVLEESKEFSKEALNEHEQMLRMRGRPKILLARNYEEATHLFEQYKDNLFGVITDMSFNCKDEKDALAGYKLTKWIRCQNEHIPVIITSAEVVNKKYADELDCPFIAKKSKTFPLDLRRQIMNNFGYGDFVIINPQTNEEICHIKNLKDLQKSILNIPSDSVAYHMTHKHFTRFFSSRALFPIAEWLKKIKYSDFKDAEEARKIVYNAIIEYRRIKNSGIVAVFDKDRFDEFSNFVRIGKGSIGGKGRSIAFMDNLVKEHSELNNRPNVVVKIPRTVVVCTDIFDEFMESNELYSIALSDSSDEEILQHFLRAKLPERLTEDFIAFLNVIKAPIAVRSSSLLEDSHYQPFAGVYATYMIPSFEDKEKTLSLLLDAIKSVYASVFYVDSKTYMTATQNLIDQEKMAVVLQETVGSTYGTRFYPTLSGVARSLNFYPVGNEKPEEGIANIVLGLGKYIVEGNMSLRFSPYYPHNILQLSTVDLALRDTQRYFFALNLEEFDMEFSTNDGFNLLKLSVKEADKDNSIRYIASTYDPNEQSIYDGYYDSGRKLITFAGILQHDIFPLADILKIVLNIGASEMGRAVEIEFAVDLKKEKEGIFYLLQIRPIVQNKELMNEDLSSIKQEETILYSTSVLGHGISNEVHDIIYVKTEKYNAINNPLIASQIGNLNMNFLDEDKNYVLIGPGRWGSSDEWLGVPVKWSQICNAKLLVELSLDNYKVEPSQGTHFFQNLTSFGVGYFSINTQLEDGGFFDEQFLNDLPAVYESEFIRHVRLERPLSIKIDGKKNIGAVLRCDVNNE